MDTNQYSNILSALGQNQGQTPAPTQGLTNQQQADNYRVFQDLMKKGVYIPDVMKRLDDLEDKVKTMQEAKPDVNKELFAVMEAAVKQDPDVKRAKQKVADIKSMIIAELCSKDTRFQEALNEYRTAVNAAYIHQKEQASDRVGADGVRHDTTGRVPDKEGVSYGEKERTCQIP